MTVTVSIANAPSMYPVVLPNLLITAPHESATKYHYISRLASDLRDTPIYTSHIGHEPYNECVVILKRHISREGECNEQAKIQKEVF